MRRRDFLAGALATAAAPALAEEWVDVTLHLTKHQMTVIQAAALMEGVTVEEFIIRSLEEHIGRVKHGD